MSRWESFKTFFRKHDFDLDNSKKELVIVDTKNRDVFSYDKYVCSRCGETLALMQWQMKNLPWGMARGCKGKKDNIN
jgi:hypothetical protein